MTARTAPRARPALITRNARIQRLSDPAQVRPLFAGKEAYAAYALAYLDPRLFSQADFFIANSGTTAALVMHSRGGLGAATLLMGDLALVSTLLQLHPGPRQTFLTCELPHVEEVLRTHNLWRPQNMMRMEMNAASFRLPDKISAARRLINTDAAELNRLYAIEGDGLHYDGRQIEEGVYYGAFFRDRLISAAGTHIHSLHEGVGVIGNVFTHPDHRRRGLGTAVTAGVAETLLQTCDMVVLNVDPANRTARHIYEQLGFREQHRLVEALATRREPMSPLPLLRRTVARWRTREAGVELIGL